MDNNKTIAMLRFDLENFCYVGRIGQQDQFGNVPYLAQPLTFVSREPGTFNPPTFTLQKPEAQALFDDLWGQGFRPKSEDWGNETKLALQSHLTDMRTIAFHKLGIK